MFNFLAINLMNNKQKNNPSDYARNYIKTMVIEQFYYYRF